MSDSDNDLRLEIGHVLFIDIVDYKAEKFEEKVSDVDVVFDTVGGDTQERAFQTLKRGGYLVSTVNPPSPEKAKQFGVTVAMVVMMPKPDQLAEINRLQQQMDDDQAEIETMQAETREILADIMASLTVH